MTFVGRRKLYLCVFPLFPHANLEGVCLSVAPRAGTRSRRHRGSGVFQAERAVQVNTTDCRVKQPLAGPWGRWAEGGTCGHLSEGGCSDSSGGVIRVGDVPLLRTEPEPEPLSPEAAGTPPPQPPTLAEARGYYDMLSNKSSRISQLIVYIEVS